MALVPFQSQVERIVYRDGVGSDCKFSTRLRKKTSVAGWAEERARKLAERYDNQTDDEQVAEHELALRADGLTEMVVPPELILEIVELINKKEPASDHDGSKSVTDARHEIPP